MLKDEIIEQIASRYVRVCGDHWVNELAMPEEQIIDFARAIEKAGETMTHDTRLSLDHDKYYDAYHELRDAAIALVQRLELDKDVKENNWWLTERAKIMEAIDDNKGL